MSSPTVSPYFIAVSGKGGVGKTTISSLIVRELIANQMAPVLAIDADPNSCLDEALGVKATHSVGTAREDVRTEAQKGLAAGASKQEMLEMKIAESLVEAKGFDLIAMGRPEGPGCYCYANNVLKSVIASVAGEYPYVVLDNEAGLENLSRRIVQKVNMLILISDPSNAGLETLIRLQALAQEMEISYERLVIIMNRIRKDRWPEKVEQVRAATQADEVIGLPDNEEIAQVAETNGSCFAVSEDNPVIKQINDIILKIRK